jgi:Transposase DDE domain group 1
MSSFKTACNSEPSFRQMNYGALAGRPIVGEFNGGLLLIQRLDEHLGLSKQIAACFTGRRDPSRIEHRIDEQIGQRLYGLVQGYEDLNDHDILRHDLMMEIAVGKLQRRWGEGAILAGKSTLNRLEKSHRRDDSIEPNPRYVKTELNPEKLEQVFLEVFIAQYPKVPKELILDLDVTDDPTYGQQECAEFNGYYHSTCYTALSLFCGRHLLAARLRPANVDPAAGALEEIQRIVGAIQQRWPGVKILVRGDSAYSRDEIMSWCEATPNVDYVFAHRRML